MQRANLARGGAAGGTAGLIDLIGSIRSIESNTGMDHPHPAVEQRLIDLEIKASFTEDFVDHLNQIVARQQDQIDVLLRELAALRQQGGTAEPGEFRSLHDDLPPHY